MKIQTPVTIEKKVGINVDNKAVYEIWTLFVIVINCDFQRELYDGQFPNAGVLWEKTGKRFEDLTPR